MKFSIVVNTFNRGPYLDDALRGLSELNYKDYEVVVVNGPSTDNTEDVLKKWKDVIKLAKCNEPNLSMSRNVGIEHASGDVIAFIDDDAVPHPEWLNRLAIHYADSRIGGVGGFTIDNTGVAYQVRKTVCDRFGNAFNPSDFFDERPLSIPGSPYYPSLLGTNSSFRASALRKIRGFDHVFAYLLDETDVCLRLIDAGYRVVYEPEAIVFHQFAASHIRNTNRIAKTLYPSAVSKSYFIKRHGAKFSELKSSQELRAYEEEILRANKWLADHGEITTQHKMSLDDDLLFGIKDGMRHAAAKSVSESGPLGDLDLDAEELPFLPMTPKTGLTIALVSRSFPPVQEAGIARWTSMMAKGLSDRGHKVHVVTLATEEPFTRYADGYWVHAIKEESNGNVERLIAEKQIPSGLAPWCSAVQSKINGLRSFGLDVVSFPIWDVEGIALAQDPSLGVVMSLHTSYAMARPFKPEWNERPLFSHFHVDRVIAAEKELLNGVGHILANSYAIVGDLEEAYQVRIAHKTHVAPHGTLDPLPKLAAMKRPLDDHDGQRGNLKVTYVGRFELRKGFDIACAAFIELLRKHEDIEFSFIGDSMSTDTAHLLERLGASELTNHPRVSFPGFLSRDQLDAKYQQSDVVVMPSRYESFGLVAIEAMAAATPVIALAAGGLKEVVDDGVTGFLVEPGPSAAREIQKAIEKLSADTELLQNMKSQARATFNSKYTVESMVISAEEIYYRAARKAA